jgi:ketosteroid isomerase-like protein
MFPYSPDDPGRTTDGSGPRDTAGVPTPEELVEMVTRGHEAFNRQDIDAALEFAHPDIEWHPAFGESLLGASVYRGREGFRRYFEQVNEVLERFMVVPLSFSTVGENVVLQAEISGHGRASGMEIKTEMTVVWRFRGDKSDWGATYFARDEALAAIGASEDDLIPAD